MSKVIEFNAQRFKVGVVRCHSCGHGWTAVRPFDAEPLECPECGVLDGYEFEREPRSTVSMFTGITPNKFDPDVILESAKGKLKSVVVIGWDHEDQSHFSCSDPDGPNILWLLELTKRDLLGVCDE